MIIITEVDHWVGFSVMRLLELSTTYKKNCIYDRVRQILENFEKNLGRVVIC